MDVFLAMGAKTDFLIIYGLLVHISHVNNSIVHHRGKGGIREIARREGKNP